MSTILKAALAFLAGLPAGPNYDLARHLASGEGSPQEVAEAMRLAVKLNVPAHAALHLALVAGGHDTGDLKGLLALAQATPTRGQRLDMAIASRRGGQAKAVKSATAARIAALEAELAALRG